MPSLAVHASGGGIRTYNRKSASYYFRLLNGILPLPTCTVLQHKLMNGIV
jgi:hypothetical protein